MRILVISNLYPPHYIGGYELGCHDAVEGLRMRGHDVVVLTSDYGRASPGVERHVYRWLASDLSLQENRSLPVRLLGLVAKELRNRRCFLRLCKSFRPDLIYMWNPALISISLPLIAQKMNLPVAFYVFDHWMERWQMIDYWRGSWLEARNSGKGGRLRKLAARLISRVDGTLDSDLDLSGTQFASHFLKEMALRSGKAVAGTAVIHWGIASERFQYRVSPGHPTRLLYVGQVAPHKGVHTAIESMQWIGQEFARSGLHLSIVGGCMEAFRGYMTHLKEQVDRRGLRENVHFTGFVERDRLPHIYAEHDILIFPSVWEEPFGITLLEAMASGLAVVGTATGGSGEILTDGFNALIFPKEEAKACAECIIRLAHNRSLFEEIRRNGRETVEARFGFDQTMKAVESSLGETLRYKDRLTNPSL